MKLPVEAKVLLLEEGKESSRAPWEELKKKGVQVTAMSDLEACLAQLVDNPDCPVLIDMDGAMNGVEAIEEVKKIAPEAVVIALTSTEKLASVEEALLHGAWDFLIKQPDLSHLQEIPQAIARNLERKKLRGEWSQIARDSECFTTAARASRDGIVIAHKGEIVFANPALCQFLGYQDGDLVGVSVEDFFPGLEIDEASWTNVTEPAPRREWRGEAAVRKKDGSEITMVTMLTETLDAEGEAEALIGFCLAPGASAAAVEPRGAVSAVKYNGVLGAPNEIVASIVEDFKTPLAAMVGYLQIACGTAPTDGESQALSLRRVDTLAKRLLDLITDHLDALAIDAGRFEINKVSLQVGQILEPSVQARKGEAAARDIEVAAKAAKDLPPLPVDPARLGRAISILISNALGIAPAGGKVEVVTSLRGKEVAIAVTNTEAEVPAEEIPFLFDRSQKMGKPGAEVNTVGLFVARHIATVHGGRLEAEKNPPEGLTLTIFLPV